VPHAALPALGRGAVPIVQGIELGPLFVQRLVRMTIRTIRATTTTAPNPSTHNGAPTGPYIDGSLDVARKVWAVKDSNLRPTGYEPAALTT
jgi:hypothetical protein